MKKTLKRIFICLTAVVLTIVIALAIYICIPNTATQEAKDRLINHPNDINVTCSDREIVCEPSNTKPIIGIIFFTGAKVESSAYSLLYQSLAKNNILLIARDNLIHISNLSMYGCEEIFDRYPDIKKWYFAGHSMGGETADILALKYQDKVVGSINLAAQPRQNFSNTNLRLLNIYASNDNIAKPQEYEDFNHNLPNDHKVFIIDGGCHAKFGDYGDQFFDGEPTISHQDQIEQTTKIICEFIKQ